MFARSHLVLCIVGLFLGCNQPSIPNSAEKPADDETTVKSQPKELEPIKTEITHVITTESEYYTTGPQQGRPPDGTFQAGTKVSVVENAGSYSIVESENGVRAYVATDSLKEANLEDRVETLLQEGRKIEALRVYRAETGVGLKEAKDAVDEIERRVENQ